MKLNVRLILVYISLNALAVNNLTAPGLKIQIEWIRWIR